MLFLVLVIVHSVILTCLLQGIAGNRNEAVNRVDKMLILLFLFFLNLAVNTVPSHFNQKGALSTTTRLITSYSYAISLEWNLDHGKNYFIVSIYRF